MSKIIIQPKYIVELSGDIVLEAAEDMWTSLDAQGRRWVRLRPGDSRDGDKLRKIIDDNIKTHLFKEYNIFDDSFVDLTLHDVIQDQSSKDRHKIYKWYFDMIERTLNSHYQLLNKHLKNTSQKLNYNELVINNIKVLGAYIIREDISPDQIKKLKIPFLGYITQKDLSRL